MTSDKENLMEMPETIRCPKCGYFVSTEATECRFCQATLSETIDSLKRTINENLRKLDEAKAENGRRRKAFLSNKTNWAIAIAATTAIVAGAIILTPPPLTDAELVFQTGCKSIDANLDDFLSTQIKLGEFPWPDWITWPEHYAVSNAGVRSRTVTRTSIDTNFPWIVAATNENLASINRTEFLKHPSPFFVENGTFSNDFVAWILNGSSIPVSGPDVKGYRDPALVLQNSIREVAPVGRFDDCESALGLKSGTNIASKIGDGQFEGKHLVEILWVRVDIWGCDQFGMGHAPWKSNGLGQMCAKSDFRG